MLAWGQKAHDMAGLWRAVPEKKSTDAVSYGAVEFVMDVRSSLLLQVLHLSLQVHWRDTAEGGRDVADGMMKRRAMDEKTEP